MEVEQTKVLVIADNGAEGLMLSLRNIWSLGCADSFQLAEGHLPDWPGEDFAPGVLRFLEQVAPQLVILCLSHEVRRQAEAFFAVARPEIPVLLALETSGEEDLLAMLKLGAADFVFAPFRAHDLIPRLRRLQRATTENASAAGQIKLQLGLEQFIGESPALLTAIKQIPKLARCDVSVFITGETGTGKEMFARAIHYLSPRASQPFIPVNCGAIPAELVENELFGHEPGAFTGATASARGLIHDADGGTLFLDEIDSLPLPTQVKLLRFLQDQMYRPLGARKMCQGDIRLVTAANADMDAAVRAGKFRPDLFYRINVLPLALPPLRERKEDIALLARHFAAKHARELKSPAKELSPAALQKLVCHDWPGNVRELENIIQRAVVFAEEPVIRATDIFLPGVGGTAEATSFKDLKARVILHFERAYLQRLLVDHQGNITHAAKAAEKNRRAFWQLLRKHNIPTHHAPVGTEPRLDKTRLR